MELLTLAGINVTVAVAFAAFLWRQNAALAQRFEAFSRDITGTITGTITGVDRRLARLEGWIERDRGGHSPDQA